MPAIRTYTRPMSGWYRRHAFYSWYMVREASSVIVTVYALVLLTGLWRLTQGEAAFEAWRASLASPVAIVFHLLALWLFVVHTLSWFRVMPKTMPFVRIGGKRVADATITNAGRIAAAACTVVVYALFLWGTS
ncbi:MAG: fumarate reductase subunit C [Burkholderiales bacterium]|nr:MAG: fumarate reductase subunit C [Burkholderiales bacterium]